jgi:8-oxo-dGTP diphosphatase
MTKTPRLVVGAVIVDSGRVLAARRTRPAELAGQWEFPGGKAELGENPRAALAREIREELGVSVALGAEVLDGESPWRISDQYVLRLFLASCVDAELTPGADHDQLQWVAASDLDEVDWLASDRLALQAVRTALGEL